MLKLKKIYSFAVVGLLSISAAHAIPRAPCDPPPSNVCCEEPLPGPFAFSYPRDNCLVCPRDFYFAGEFLAMQFAQNGLDYAMQNTTGAQNANNVGNVLSGGKVEAYSDDCNNWDFGYGLRVNLGFYSHHDFWNLDLTYTYLHFEQDNSSAVKGDARLLPFWLVPRSFPSLDPGGVLPEREASAQLKIHYNTLDLHLGKPHHVSRCFLMNPHFGIRVAWIDECYLARYGGTFQDATPQAPVNVLGAEMEAENDLYGVGLRAGVQTEWVLGRGFRLYGNTAASLLYAKFDIDQTVSLAGNSYFVDHDFNHNIPNFEILLGLGWSCLFNRCQQRFTLRVAYEFHQWWNVNHFRRFFDDANWSANDKVSRGDLTLNGISVRLMFEF